MLVLLRDLESQDCQGKLIEGSEELDVLEHGTRQIFYTQLQDLGSSDIIIGLKLTRRSIELVVPPMMELLIMQQLTLI